MVWTALCFPYGPLFPWSPWKPGYAKIALRRSDIYYPEGTTVPPAFLHFDQYMGESERFHRLTLPRRIEVILCRDWNDFHRFMPALRGNAVGAATLETGTVIYVTPKIAERGFDFGEFLRHELSHATVNQHQTLLRAHEASNAQWFFEGLAVSFGRQRAYVNPAEFVAFAQARNLVPVIDPSRRRPDLPWDMRFNYQTWRYFLEYQVDTKGRDRFQQLLEGMMRDPKGSDRVFSSVYGMSLPEAIDRFQSDVRECRWSPRP